MSTSDPGEETDADWEITPAGLYIATRGFLLRRGYCCANRCRNCPYVNWRNERTWQPGEHTRVQHMRVCADALAGVQTLLRYHEGQLQEEEADEGYHRSMSEHYRFLLEQWRA